MSSNTCTFKHICTCVCNTIGSVLYTIYKPQNFSECSGHICTHTYTCLLSAHLQTFVQNGWTRQKCVGWAHFGESVTPDGMLCFPASFFIQPSWSGAGLGLGIRIVVGGRILKCTWGILQIWTKWKMSVLLLHHELFSLFWNNSLPNFPLPKMHQEVTQLTVF